MHKQTEGERVWKGRDFTFYEDKALALQLFLRILLKQGMSLIVNYFGNSTHNI